MTSNHHKQSNVIFFVHKSDAPTFQSFKYIDMNKPKARQKIVEKEISKRQESDIQEGAVYHMISKEQFEGIVKEAIKTQESALNTMKLVAESIFGFSV